MSDALAGAPPSVRRLFAHYDEAAFSKDVRVFLVSRLLEEGEGADLRWLVRGTGEEVLATWVTTAGSRQLSRRSRAFWSTLLDLEASAGEEDPLWLL